MCLQKDLTKQNIDEFLKDLENDIRLLIDRVKLEKDSIFHDLILLSFIINDGSKPPSIREDLFNRFMAIIMKSYFKNQPGIPQHDFYFGLFKGPQKR